MIRLARYTLDSAIISACSSTNSSRLCLAIVRAFLSWLNTPEVAPTREPFETPSVRSAASRVELWVELRVQLWGGSGFVCVQSSQTPGIGAREPT